MTSHDIFRLALAKDSIIERTDSVSTSLAVLVPRLCHAVPSPSSAASESTLRLYSATPRRRRRARSRLVLLPLTAIISSVLAFSVQALAAGHPELATVARPSARPMIRSLTHGGGSNGGLSSPMLPSGAATPPSSLHGRPAASASLPSQGLVKLSVWSRRLPGALGGGPRSNWRAVALLLLLGALLGRVLSPAVGSSLPLRRRLPDRSNERRSIYRLYVARRTLTSKAAVAHAGHLFSYRRPPPFHVPSSDFLPPVPALARPAYHPPPPVEPAPGQAPNVVHYVYGYKPPKAGEPEGELLPYYTYLAIRSALVNLKPDAVYLCVARFLRSAHGRS